MPVPQILNQKEYSMQILKQDMKQDESMEMPSDDASAAE